MDENKNWFVRSLLYIKHAVTAVPLILFSKGMEVLLPWYLTAGEKHPWWDTGADEIQEEEEGEEAVLVGAMHILDKALSSTTWSPNVADDWQLAEQVLSVGRLYIMRIDDNSFTIAVDLQDDLGDVVAVGVTLFELFKNFKANEYLTIRSYNS